MQQNPTPDHLLVPLSIATIATPMAQPSLPETPQEIIDGIIDLCSGEKATLIAYSLTSKSWGSRTRKYLFSKLTLTDKTLPVWCKTVAIPIPSTDATPQLLADPHPPVSSALSSYVTSLKITTAYSYPETGLMGEPELLQAKLHLSAFTNVKSLILGPISFITFKYASLETCLGSLAATVRELKLSFCFLDEDSIFAILRVFSHLESLELDGNLWVHNPPLTSQNGPPTLRGSFTASGFLKESQGLLDLLATARVEYHTFTIGNNHRSTLSNFNTLLEKCGDHLKTLILTAPELGPLYGNDNPDLSLNLSPCKELVEIRGRFHHAQFGALISTLNTVQSPRFRKLSFFITAVKLLEWAYLDAAIVALTKRVCANASNDRLEVLFASPSSDFHKVQIAEIRKALPLTAANARVSLQTEHLPPLCP